jgi:hypothetical protein
MLAFVRTDLLPQCERRQFLEKSCWKLMKQLCLSICQETSVGHPFEFRTALDFYSFERSYALWNSTRTLGAFEKLVSFLYSLIYRRISNLYLILHISPTLIYELTVYYKNTLHSLKQSVEQHEQQELSQMIGLCSSFVALVCEYYQTLKNTEQNRMVEEQEEGYSERTVLDLL